MWREIKNLHHEMRFTALKNRYHPSNSSVQELQQSWNCVSLETKWTPHWGWWREWKMTVQLQVVGFKWEWIQDEPAGHDQVCSRTSENNESRGKDDVSAFQRVGFVLQTERGPSETCRTWSEGRVSSCRGIKPIRGGLSWLTRPDQTRPEAEMIL